MSFKLVGLPDELVTHVIEHVEDKATLCSLAITCAHLRDIAENVLYRSVLQRTDDQAVLLRKAIQSRPERAKALHVLDSRCKWHNRKRLDAMIPVIDAARNLTELTLESPYCNRIVHGSAYDRWTDLMHQLLAPIFLPNPSVVDSRLRTLTLHLSGETERYWTVDSSFSFVFSSSTIQNLTLSCASLNETCVEGLDKGSHTPLKRLVLIECNITHHALRSILRLPQALEVLYLGENCCHAYHRYSYANQLCGQQPTAFFTSLSQQQESLKDMTYVVEGPRKAAGDVHIPSDCHGFANFSQLQHLTIDGHCLYFEKAIASEQTAPANLLSLVAKGDMFRLPRNASNNTTQDYHAHVDWMLQATSMIKSLSEVKIVSTRTFTNISQAHRDTIATLGDTFKQTKVAMQLYKRQQNGSIPPFLFGERPYSEDLIYDNEDRGFIKEKGSSGSREADDIDF